MAAASPTPFGNSYHDFPRPAPPRQTIRNPPLRPHLKRASPLTLVSINSALTVAGRQDSIGDSSDDEEAAPLLSIEAEALLAEELQSVVDPRSAKPIERTAGDVKRMIDFSEGSPSRRMALQSTQLRRQDRSGSPLATSRPRVVRLSAGSSGSATLRRTVSTSSIHEGSPMDRAFNKEINTPAPRSKTIQNTVLGPRAVEGDSSNKSRPKNYAERAPSTETDGSNGGVVPIGSITANRNKMEESGMHSSMRINRFSKVTGTGGFLKGPARRGIIRRHSEDDQSPAQKRIAANGGDPEHVSPENGEEEQPGVEVSPLLAEGDKAQCLVDQHHGLKLAQVSTQSQPNVKLTEASLNAANPPMARSPPTSAGSKGSSGKRVVPIFNVRAPPLPSLPSRYDQENQEPPPTFRRNKLNGLDLLEAPQRLLLMDSEKKPMLGQTLATATPHRAALASRSQNTPHRPAPPPPKMLIIDTVTATAGAAASASQSKRKRNLVTVNGKHYQRLECIGRGGSGKVYKVMAENYKILALKRVQLEEIDDIAIRGFKGEIDLLKKFVDVPRVVQLFDYEVNDEKQTLSVVMEIGESDFNKVLNLRMSSENAKVDITFTRFYWKEMVECIKAVHDKEVVHSDLKPANFVLINNSLKLIDFGIANAIQDDTVNVHRDTQIGTPNYMAPESIVDANATNGVPSAAGKLMKLGKPSDIWSLGCILYQMVYSKPPFAHLPNQLAKVVAITNRNHVIEFRKFGIGNVPLPNSLIQLLKRCLNRDPQKRPTADELLADDDPFLHPDLPIPGTVLITRDLLATIQRNMAHHVKKNGLMSEPELAKWAELSFSSIKKTIEEGRAR